MQKEAFRKPERDKIGPSGSQEECESKDSRNATVELFCLGGGTGSRLMANDTGWEAAYAGRAWAGHSGGRAGRHVQVWEAMDRSAVEGWTFQDAAAGQTSAVARKRQRSHSSALSQSLWGAHAGGNGA